MTTDANTRLSSYADYAAIDDGQRYEVLDGELVLMASAPFLEHQDIVAAIFVALRAYAGQSRAGKAYVAAVDVVLQADTPGTVLQPDVLFIRREHFDRLTPANVQGPPDIVVEVLSPSTARHDTIRKRALYERFGVQEYWIVPLHDERIEVLRLEDGRYGRPIIFDTESTLTSPLLPGFELAIADVFPADEAL